MGVGAAQSQAKSLEVPSVLFEWVEKHSCIDLRVASLEAVDLAVVADMD